MPVASFPAPVVHHRVHTHRITCAVPPDRRDPASNAWRDVTCRNCLAIGFVEVRLNRWTVYAPEEAAESVLLVLEGASALITGGRRPKELRYPMRRLLSQYLQARLPGDAGLHGLQLRRFRAHPSDPVTRVVE
jgi:hypothetical protein